MKTTQDIFAKKGRKFCSNLNVKRENVHINREISVDFSCKELLINIKSMIESSTTIAMTTKLMQQSKYSKEFVIPKNLSNISKETSQISYNDEKLY